MAGGINKGVGGGHDRYKTVEERLEKSQNTLTEDDAMKLLEAVSVKGKDNWGTIWSIVYNIDRFTMKICCNTDYDRVFVIE